MFKPVPGNKLLTISLSQEFRDLEGYPVDLPLDENRRVEIELYGAVVRICPIWLSSIAHYEMYFEDPSFKKLLNVDFRPNNVKFFKCNSSNLPIFRRPVTITIDSKVYRVISTHCRYAIAADGDMIDVASKTKITIGYNRKKNGVVMTSYPYVYVYDPDKAMYRYLYVHRLVAIAWVKHPDNDFVRKPIVNHKDSDKNNFNARNLEWCSFKHNSLHCYESGVRNDNIKCRVRDFTTGVVTEFNSKSQAAEFMGVEKSSLNKVSLYVRKGKLIKNKYEFKLNEDETPWFYEGLTERVKHGRYLITAIDRDGNHKYYHDLRDFKKDFSVWNVPNVKEILNRAKQLHPEYKFLLTDYYHSEPIEVYEHKTGKVIEKPTITAMSKLTGVAEHIIRNCVNGKETWVYSGYAFRYKKEEPWDKDFEIRSTSRGKAIRAENLVTGETITFPSLRAASRGLVINDRYWMRNCLEQGVEYKGWKFNWVQ